MYALMPPTSFARRLSTTLVPAAIILAGSASFTTARAQGATKSKHAPVFAEGVKQYDGFASVPTPYDTLQMPPSPGPIRVTSEEEARAADLEIRKRAGSVGATGIVVSDKVEEDGGARRVQRQSTAIFVRADSARAYKACVK